MKDGDFYWLKMRFGSLTVGKREGNYWRIVGWDRPIPENDLTPIAKLDNPVAKEQIENGFNGIQY